MSALVKPKPAEIKSVVNILEQNFGTPKSDGWLPYTNSAIDLVALTRQAEKAAQIKILKHLTAQDRYTNRDSYAKKLIWELEQK